MDVTLRREGKLPSELAIALGDMSCSISAVSGTWPWPASIAMSLSGVMDVTLRREGKLPSELAIALGDMSCSISAVSG
ncbi:hypothetical protein CKJ90_31410, partial [Klebsiella pneumoniae]